jgi:hypothetical protein
MYIYTVFPGANVSNTTIGTFNPELSTIDPTSIPVRITETFVDNA